MGDLIILALELIFCLFLFYWIFEEIKEVMNLFLRTELKFFQLRSMGVRDYIQEFWNFVDWLNIIVWSNILLNSDLKLQLFIVVIITRIKSLVDISNMNMKPTPTEYVSYQPLLFWLSQEQNVNAFSNQVKFLHN